MCSMSDNEMSDDRKCHRKGSQGVYTGDKF